MLSKPLAWAQQRHCSRCRKAHGVAFATNAIAPLEALRFTRGEDRLRSDTPPEAERFTNVFCGECGSAMPFANVARGRFVIPMGSLDGDPGHLPDAHMFVDSRASSDRTQDDLPQYRGLLGGELADGEAGPEASR